MTRSGPFSLGDPWYAPPGDANSLPTTYWADPLRGPGVLGSEAITSYCGLFGMVRPFAARSLRAASYVLRLGAQYWSEGQLHTLGAQEELIIGPRSTVVIVPAEVLLVPHYLVGRLGLAVGAMHKGLLLGTGTQVDPGYQGALSCPLYNLTGRPARLSQDEPFARLDFLRVGADEELRSRLATIATEDALYAAAQAGELRDQAGRTRRLFSRSHRWRDPFADGDYLPARLGAG